MNLDELSNVSINNNTYKDYLEYYSLLSANLCRKTSHSEINKQYCIKKMNYRKDILAAYPDQNNGVDKWC